MQTLKPGIRFKGFTDDWEQRKLSHICDKFADGDWIEAKDQSDSGVRLIQTGNIGVTEYIDKLDSAKWVSLETFYRLHCKEVYEGDILISRLPEPAGRACIIPNLGTKMITAVDCTIVRTNSYNSSKFLVQYLSTQIYFDEVNTCLAGGTRQRISRSNLADFNVFIPKIQEQQKIGSLFEQTDKLITLYKQKYEKLTTIKKSLLAKMFPAEGESAPQIRFKGFTEPWQKRKVGELGIIVTGSTPSTSIKTYYSEDGISWVTPTDITDVTISTTPRKLSLEGERVARILPPNTVLITCIASIGKNTLLTTKGSCNQQINALIPIKECDPYFLLSNSFLWSKEMKRQAASGTMQIVNKSEFSEMLTKIPTIKEQQQIGAFFAKLDNLIATYKQKYEKLQTLKNSLLNKMFV